MLRARSAQESWYQQEFVSAKPSAAIQRAIGCHQETGVASCIQANLQCGETDRKDRKRDGEEGQRLGECDRKLLGLPAQADNIAIFQ
jgi:hypothetical protein